MGAILLIDDNEAYCQQIQKTLALRDYELQYETDPYKALELAVNQEWDVILLDIVLYRDLDGLEILEKIKKAKPILPVIMVSAASTIQTAQDAVQKGAFDYLEKPINVERITITIKHALDQKRLLELNQNLVNEFYRSVATNTLSRSLQQILDLIGRLNEPLERILLFGEKGTGKELLAKLLHFKSERRYGRFVPFYCDAQKPEQENRLFGESVTVDGHVSSESLIAQADKGTLFIGEISNLSKNGQQWLARFVHENYYMPSSGKNQPTLNIRLIASTSMDLASKVNSGDFSDELFNLLNTFTFRLPPLRERQEDIPLLAEHFLSEMNIQYNNSRPGCTEEAIKKLQSHHWSGNISELKTIIWILSFFHRSSEIDLSNVESALQFYRLMKRLRERHEWHELSEEFRTFYELFNESWIQNFPMVK